MLLASAGKWEVRGYEQHEKSRSMKNVRASVVPTLKQTMVVNGKMPSNILLMPKTEEEASRIIKAWVPENCR